MPLIAVIDASNVAWQGSRQPWFGPRHGKSRPPMHGLVICINYCVASGFIPKAIVPAWWTGKHAQSDLHNEDEDSKVLMGLIDANVCHVCPGGTQARSGLD